MIKMYILEILIILIVLVLKTKIKKINVCKKYFEFNL